MSIYVVQGKLGQGKSLSAVSKIRQYLSQGRKVATNLDLKVELLLPSSNRTACVLRVPDKPKAADLVALGLGCPTVDEERYGLLVLDELGSWLNARDWADGDRAPLFDWLIHSRKFGWDVIFIVQDASIIDKQVRVALMEYLVTCKRMDKIPIPFFGLLVRMLSFGAVNLRLPKFHLCPVSYSGGSSITPQNSIVVDRWIFRGRDLYQAYDTRQVFSSFYASGLFSYLPPWQQHGRYLPLNRWQVFLAAAKSWFCRPSRKLSVGVKVRLLMRLPPQSRWRVARTLVLLGDL